MTFSLRSPRVTGDSDLAELQLFLRGRTKSEERRNDDDDYDDANRSINYEPHSSGGDENRFDHTSGSTMNTTILDKSDTTSNSNVPKQKSVLPLSMRFMRHMPTLLYCPDCVTDPTTSDNGREQYIPSHANKKHDDDTDIVLANYEHVEITSSSSASAASPMVVGPMLFGGIAHPQEQSVMERIMSEYIKACHFYGCGDRVNAGVLTSIRFSVPSLRVRGSFHDADMLALGEILLKYANGPLRYIRRLDFNIVSSKSSTAKDVGRVPGFGSHGALTLSKILQSTQYINEVLLERNRIGSYGATAIFIACSQNSTITKLGMRGCMVGPRAALTFAEFICLSPTCSLTHIDLSCNALGYIGCSAIENGITKRRQNSKLHEFDHIDLEGNLILQEIMNGVTHGLGVIIAIVGASLLLKRVEGKSMRHVVSCYIYSASLVVLYLVSTLYHSFFTLKTTKSIFQIMDKSAIYILIAGSYTPFLQIVLGHNPVWGVYLLTFLWVCCIMGIWVEFAFPVHPRTGTFSLAMYLAMGWSCVVCLPEVAKILPESMIYMFLGGVAYTGGVPFFIRANNLDHAIWHLFVLAGSILHWCGIYFHVAPLP